MTKQDKEYVYDTIGDKLDHHNDFIHEGLTCSEKTKVIYKDYLEDDNTPEGFEKRISLSFIRKQICEC